MKYQDTQIYKEVEQLDEIAKSKIYFHWWVKALAFEKSILLVNNGHTTKPINYGSCRVETNIKFEDFVDPTTNICITDIGEVWKERGYAQRFQVRVTGIYYWFDTFREELEKFIE